MTLNQINPAMPLLMVDVVLLTLLDGELQVGLVLRTQPDEPFPNVWCLPGGFIHTQEDASAEDTARRVLKAKADVESPYLEQLVTVTGAERDPRGWSASIVYYALVPPAIAPENSERFRWSPVSKVMERPLPFDHARILEAAVTRVRSKTSYSALPVHLMGAQFTMRDLWIVYQQLLGGHLERRGFVRRIEDMDVLEETGTVKKENYRPAKLYRLKAGRGRATLESALVAT